MDRMDEEIQDESSGPYYPFDRKERYPKRLKVDFRRLPVRVPSFVGLNETYTRSFFLVLHIVVTKYKMQHLEHVTAGHAATAVLTKT